ncbi:MAG: hypothetical protein ACPL0B_02580, partial [Anaerolineales bacterium]
MNKPAPHQKDLEIISAYLDGEINDDEKRRIKARLEENQELHKLYEELLHTRALLRSQPLLHAPRNFTLNPQMVEKKSQFWTFFKRPFVFYQYASAALSLIFGIWFCFNILVQNKSTNLPMAAVPAARNEAAPIAPNANVPNYDLAQGTGVENMTSPEPLLKMAPPETEQTPYPLSSMPGEVASEGGEITSTQVITEAPLMKALIASTETPTVEGQGIASSSGIPEESYPYPEAG